MNEEKKIAAFVELIVECKNSSNPLAFILRRKNEADAFTVVEQFRYPVRYEMKKDLGAGRSLSRELNGFFHLGFSDIHYGHRTPTKAVQFCRIDRKGSAWHANHGGLYDAMFYPMAKAVTARLASVRSGTGPDAWKYLWLMFPIVVTTSDLLAIDTTIDNPSPDPQDWVRFSRDLKGGKISGNYVLDFVRQDQLAKFVNECITPLGDLAKDLVENRTEFLLNAACPWEE